MPASDELGACLWGARLRRDGGGNPQEEADIAAGPKGEAGEATPKKADQASGRATARAYAHAHGFTHAMTCV